MNKIGWAQRDFTPDRPAMIQGQMHRRIGSSAIDPLTVTAMAVEGRKAKIIIISTDMAYITDELTDEVASAMKGKYPIFNSDDFIINATHTHTSLVIDDDFYDYPGGNVMRPAEARALLVQKCVEAAIEAWENRQPVMIGRAFSGNVVVGHNRYAIYSDGMAQMYGKTNRPDFTGIGGYEDHSMDMLFTWDTSGILRGIILDIPCPSQVDEHLESFSADYWHDIRSELRKRFGAHINVLSFCGAAGDQSPHLLVYGKEEADMLKRRGLTERQEIARRVANAVEDALVATVPVMGDFEIKHLVRRVKLERFKIMAEHKKWAKERLKEWSNAGGDPESWWPRLLREVIKAGKQTQKPPFVVTVHAVRLGDAAIVTNPFELFQEYGLRMKSRSPAAQTLVVQLACGRGMYLPSERANKSGGYGANPVVCQVGPEGGSTLVETSLKMLNQLFGGK